MAKARLIKKENIVVEPPRRPVRVKSGRKAIAGAVDSVANWLDQKRQNAKIDPRKAFAELFSQPQTN